MNQLHVKKNKSNKLDYLSLEDPSFIKVVDWLVHEEGYTLDFANQCKKEFLMVAAIGINPQNPLFKYYVIVPSASADKFLHTFLLFNYDYNNWCISKYNSIIYHYPKKTSNEGWEITQNAVKINFFEVWNKPGTSGLGEACIDLGHW